MPELPEVETTRRGLLPYVRGKRITRVIVRDTRLRWPIPANFAALLADRTVVDVTRRGKYLLWECHGAKSAGPGFVLSHLGMSGSLRVVERSAPAAKHDHVDFIFDQGTVIRFTDPRRFGAMLWIDGPEPQHTLLDVLGPEPLEDEFDGTHLFAASRGRSVSVKEFVMNSHIVVGVGNIYASESLFRAGIHPTRRAGAVSLSRYIKLAQAIKDTLAAAIRAGGSSLRDYVQTDGELGYFQVNAAVYDRADAPCRVCRAPIRQITQGARSTYYCTHCQR
jgi:formamidopyrimidine-DNA glycosylase